MEAARELVEAGDLNGLLRLVDGCATRREWDAMVTIAELCEDALERGKQLWPIANHVDYRLALEAPGEYAASVLTLETPRFLAGPLTEVAASTHTWEELAPHIDDDRIAAYVAQERVIRGEDLRGRADVDEDLLGLPLVLQGWEPAYRLAVYRHDHVEIPEPWTPRAPLRAADPIPANVLSDELEGQLLDLVTPWVNESSGAARAVVVEGDAVAACSRLTFGSLRMAPLTHEEALQQAAWAAASGGVHGRRRGAALGRLLVWSLLTAMCDQPWPADPDGLGSAQANLGWYRWDEGDEEAGWILKLAVEDPTLGWAAAISASDVAEEDATAEV